MVLVLESIEHEKVAAFRRERVRAVADDDLQALVIGRKRELPARRRHDALVELDYPDPRAAEMLVEELRQRPAPEADHERLARRGMQEQERHHAAGVIERKRERVGNP